MVEPSVRGNAPQAAARAGLRVVRAEEHAADARVDDGAGAHGARLKRHIEVAVNQPFRSDLASRFAQRKNFGMGGGIKIAQSAVAGGCEHDTVFHDDGPHRHLAQSASVMRGIERKRHRLLQIVGHGMCLFPSLHLYGSAISAP